MNELTTTQRWYLTRLRRGALYAAGVTNERRNMLMEMAHQGLLEWHSEGQPYEAHWRIAEKGTRLLADAAETRFRKRTAMIE